MNAEKVLVIAAHPDDELLGCGGTISKYIGLGAAIKILFLGEGSSCRYDDPTCEASRSAIEFRNSCAIKSLREIGVLDFEFYNLPCGRFDQTPIIIINKIIEAIIEEFRPDTIFTHSEFDSNNDHKITHRSTIMATRPCGSHIVKRLFAYEVLSSSEWSFITPFTPNYFVSLTKAQLEAKWAALKHYDGEMRAYPFPRSWSGVKSLAMNRGIQSGVEFAEAFYLVRGFD